jgi:putative MATE family efflux protein
LPNESGTGVSAATVSPTDLLETDASIDTAPIASDAEIRGRVIRLAAPISIEYLLQTGVSAVNTFLVARLGEDALAGVGIATPIIFFMIALFSAISIGATVLVSNAIGANDPDRASRLARQALSWGVLLAIPLAITGYLIAGFTVEHFGDDHNVQAIATEYLQIVAGLSIVMLIAFLCGAILRGAGDGKTPLKAAVLANIVSVVASFLLIEGHFGFPDWGIKGAAWGTVFGRAVGAAFLLVVLWRGKGQVTIQGRKGWFPEREPGRDIFRLGVPAALEQISNEGGFIVITALSASVSAAALTAHQIGLTAMDLWFMPGFAFAVTATSLVGQSVGAGKIKEGVVAARYSRNLGLVWMLAGTVLFILGKTVILKLFSDDPDVIASGRNALIVIGIQLPIWGLGMTATGALRGSGDTRSPMIRGVIATWITVMIAWSGVHYFDQGVAWIWGAYIFTMPFIFFGNKRAFERRTKEMALA